MSASFRMTAWVIPALAVALVRPLVASEAALSPAAVYPTCGNQAGVLGGADTLRLARGSGVIQPLQDAGNLASVEPRTYPAYYSTATLELVEWDPMLLVPDEGSTVLRSMSFTPSNLAYGQTKFSFDPPIVVRQALRLAEPPPRSLAFRWWNDYYLSGGEQAMRYSGNGDPAFPTALSAFHPVGGPYPPLPGLHAVMDHSTCLGDFALQTLLLAQCVRSANGVLGQTVDVAVQRFRVPMTVRLAWIEMCMAPFANPVPLLPGTIELHDAAGQSVPPAVLGTPLAQANFITQSRTTTGWVSHGPLDQTPLLHEGQDYWLVVRMRHECAVHTKVLDGTQSVDFAAQIGPLFSADGAGLGWTPVPDRALTFRVIGAPVDPLGVPPTARAPLALRVSPNPMRGDARVAWSGAVGRVRFEVLDARGRRVGGGRSESAAGGWTWRAVDESGSPLPAGVYFVRATDEAGRVGRERVVMVR